MSDWNGPLCVTAETSEIPCHEWLCGDSGDSTRWPKHICPGVMAWSVRHFIEQRSSGDWQAAFDGFWPLPAGARAIQEWPAHAENAAQNWAILQAMHRELTAFSVRDVPPIDIPRWYFPVVTDNADAQIGIAAQRHIDGVGRVWLLGLVERDTDNPSWWRWADPVILTEASTTKAGGMDDLKTKAKELLRWYCETLWRKRTRLGAGGQTPVWFTQDECREAIVKAIRYQLGQNSAQLQKDVAQQLFVSVSTLRDNLRRFHLDWRELVKEAKARS